MKMVIICHITRGSQSGTTNFLGFSLSETAAIICSEIILNKMKAFDGEPAPFVMELLKYHILGLNGVLIKCQFVPLINTL